MKIAITGSRSITNKDWVNYHIDKMLENAVSADLPITIVSGGAKGPDSIAHEYADNMRYDFILFKPYHLIDNQEPFRARFFFARNKQIVDNSDEIVCFWDGKSSGTKSVIEYATKRGKQLTVIMWDEKEAKQISDDATDRS
jgi:predicted Rossmann fold nucleotide-binding protein DprA/Smf involved in DNA uptake